MKTLISLIVIFLAFTHCSEKEMIDPEVSNASLLSSANTEFASFNLFGDNTLMQSTCPQTSTYSVQLRTLSGQLISRSNVLPNTQYDVVITYTGSFVCCANPAYCFISQVGFTSSNCLDASSGSRTFRITTNPVLPPFGIQGTIAPTDCSGSSSSVNNCFSCWREIP